MQKMQTKNRRPIAFLVCHVPDLAKQKRYQAASFFFQFLTF